MRDIAWGARVRRRGCGAA